MSALSKYVEDDYLGYERSRTKFVQGEPLFLDAQYRLAHLPLIHPEHPRVIATKEGSHYHWGRHPEVYSVVVPVPGQLICQSEAYRKLDGEIRNSPLSDKIAWDIVEKRNDKLHATICGSLSIGTPPHINANVLSDLASIGSFSIQLRGVFSGNMNLGRLYLAVYPERRSKNPLADIQRIFGTRETGLYLVGIWNLREDLDLAETNALRAIIERWRERTILEMEVTQLSLLKAADDLALDSSVTDVLPLSRV